MAVRGEQRLGPRVGLDRGLPSCRCVFVAHAPALFLQNCTDKFPAAGETARAREREREWPGENEAQNCVSERARNLQRPFSRSSRPPQAFVIEAPWNSRAPLDTDYLRGRVPWFTHPCICVPPFCCILSLCVEGVYSLLKAKVEVAEEGSDRWPKREKR